MNTHRAIGRTSAALVLGFAVLGSVLPQASAAVFTVNSQRLDPYKNFKFRLKWNGQYVAGVATMSTLKPESEVTHRDGGDPSTTRKSPGRNEFDAITFERGITQDQAFAQWAAQVWRFGSGPGSEVSLANYRKDIYLEVYSEAGQIADAYTIYHCLPSEYRAQPGPDGNSAIAIQRLTLQCEGWERDNSVAGPPPQK
jgi:phage tail-like protein